MEKKQKKSGGVRKESGPKSKFGEPMVRYGKRVPRQILDKITKLVDIEVREFEILYNEKLQNEKDKK